MDWFIDYYKAFGSFPYHVEPSEDIVIEDPDGSTFLVNEPESVTRDRIRRSMKCGHNLFFIELPPFNPYPMKDVNY